MKMDDMLSMEMQFMKVQDLDKNPILSLGLIRNSFDLIIDLSTNLGRDAERQAKWKDILSKISDFPVQTRNGRKVFRYTEEGVDWVDGNGLGIQHIYPSNAITLDSDKELLDSFTAIP